MSERKVKPLRAELVTCIAITVCGLNLHKSFFPHTLWTRLFPVFAIVGMILCILLWFLDFTKGTEEELEREKRDERNLVIQDRASWFCWRVENVLLITVFGVCPLFLRYEITYTISYVLYWIILLRYWLFFATRWWMNRNY